MSHCFPKLPLLHFLFHVDALFLQQLPLGEGPVHGLSRRLGTRGPLPLSPGLHGVVEPEHVALPQDDAITCGINTDSECVTWRENCHHTHAETNRLTDLTWGQWAPSLSCRWRKSQLLRRAPGQLLLMRRESEMRLQSYLTIWTSVTDKPVEAAELHPLSPIGPVELVKVQCSSLMKWPLRTMSWRLLASTRPTLKNKEDRVN